MKKITRILYIITSPKLGGAQVHLLSLILHLPSYIQAQVIVGEAGWLSDELIKHNIQIYYVDSLVRQISPLKDTRAVFELNRVINKVQPDLIHCHSSKAGFLGRLSARICGVPVIFTAHGWAFTNGVSLGKRMVYRMLERISALCTDSIICVSEYDKQLGSAAMSESKEKLITIHNALVDINEKCMQQHVFLHLNNRVRLVMVARFDEQKDQRLLLKALSQLRKENIRFDCTFVGDGPLLGNVSGSAEAIELVDDVQFLGARLDVDLILSKQDVFVLTSNWEGFPISILEAMRQGLPVVASDVGGVSEAVIDGQTGFLVQRGDVDLLASRLRELNNNIELQKNMGTKGREIYEEKFTLDKMVSKVLTVYNDVINKEVLRK